MGSTGKKTPDWMRVLRSLQGAGAMGITQADWNRVGHTPDGGPQIPQITRRIHELKHKHGHTIETRGQRDGFARYVLVREAWSPITPPPADDQDQQQEHVDEAVEQPALELAAEPPPPGPLTGTPYDAWSDAA